MAEKKLKCRILTPSKPIFEEEVEFLVVPAYDGELGVLKGHANLVANLGCGQCRIVRKGEKEKEEKISFYVEGGVLKIVNSFLKEDSLTEAVIITHLCIPLSEVVNQKEKWEKELEEAKAMKITDDESFEKASWAVQVAKTKLYLAEKA